MGHAGAIPMRRMRTIPIRTTEAICAAFLFCFNLTSAQAADGSAARQPSDDTTPYRFERLDPGDNAAETYDLNALGLVHVKTGWALFSKSEWWRPIRGRYRYAMTYVDFFDAAGRPDLAASQSAHNTISDLLFYGGLLVLAGGAVVAVHGATSSASGETIVGLGLLGGGLASAIVGGAISGPIVDENEASTLADGYNRALSDHLRVDRTSSRSGSGTSWAFVETPLQFAIRAQF
jgi:hypothetical protein